MQGALISAPVQSDWETAVHAVSRHVCPDEAGCPASMRNSGCIQSVLLVAGQLAALQQNNTFMVGGDSYICMWPCIRSLGCKTLWQFFSCFHLQIG